MGRPNGTNTPSPTSFLRKHAKEPVLSEREYPIQDLLRCAVGNSRRLLNNRQAGTAMPLA